jgi:hypothetical protein
MTGYGSICIEYPSSASQFVSYCCMLRLVDTNFEDGRWMELAQDRVQWKVSNLRVLPLVRYLFLLVQRPLG